MKKGKSSKHNGLRSEYRRSELGAGVRGKYLKSYRAGTNLILLSPDVAKVFPDEKTVNDALRTLIHVAQRSAGGKVKRAL